MLSREPVPWGLKHYRVAPATPRFWTSKSRLAGQMWRRWENRREAKSFKPTACITTYSPTRHLCVPRPTLQRELRRRGTIGTAPSRLDRDQCDLHHRKQCSRGNSARAGFLFARRSKIRSGANSIAAPRKLTNNARNSRPSIYSKCLANYANTLIRRRAGSLRDITSIPLQHNFLRD